MILFSFHYNFIDSSNIQLWWPKIPLDHIIFLISKYLLNMLTFSLVCWTMCLQGSIHHFVKTLLEIKKTFLVEGVLPKQEAFTHTLCLIKLEKKTKGWRCFSMKGSKMSIKEVFSTHWSTKVFEIVATYGASMAWHKPICRATVFGK